MKIALMLPTLKIVRFEKDKECFLSEAAKLGCEGIVVEADNNEVSQLKQLEELIKQGVKAIAIAAVNSNTAAVMVRLAKSKGVKTIAYDGILTNSPLDYCIAFDNKKIGIMMAQYALSKGLTGNYLILGGDKSNLNAISITDGALEVLTPSIKNGKIKIVFSGYIETWNGDEAYYKMRKYLKLSSGDVPSVVLAANDDIANGAIRACEEEGCPTPLVTGQDASLIGCRSIMQGKQKMTVYKPIKKLAAMAATVAYKAAKGEKIDGVNSSTNNGLYDIPTIIIDIQAVDKSNMESTVLADGFEKKDEIIAK
jgi:D-xylose transport system substrate-binding protein